MFTLRTTESELIYHGDIIVEVADTALGRRIAERQTRRAKVKRAIEREFPGANVEVSQPHGVERSWIKVYIAGEHRGVEDRVADIARSILK